MQYKGKRFIRLHEVGTYNLKNRAERFIENKGMIMEYLLSNDYSGITFYENGKPVELSSDEIKERHTKTVCSDDLTHLQTFDHEGKQYLRKIEKNPDSKGKRVVIYEMLPAIYDNETFRWTYNKKYNTRECTFTLGNFEFSCVCDFKNDVNIDVRYTKCDNRHHNRVMISSIKVNDASNETIIEAVEFWKQEFTREISSAV